MATYLANRRKGKGRPRDQTIPPNSNPTRLSKLEKVNLESLSRSSILFLLFIPSAAGSLSRCLDYVSDLGLLASCLELV